MKPEAPSDPRPDGEPYYIPTGCTECGTDLIQYSELTDEQVAQSEVLNDVPRDAGWNDEFVCPECLDGIYMDWPDRVWKGLVERVDEDDGQAL